MSEFDEKNDEKVLGENNVKKEKKKHPIRNRAIFLILFSVVCISVTVFLILKSNENNNTGNAQNVVESKKEESEFVPDGLGVKSLNDTYQANKLKIKHVLYGKPKYEYSEGYFYVQIDGLANKEIEDKINKELKDEYLAMGKETSSTCTANFANVISVCYSNYSEDGINAKTFNYDLTTGNKIELKDMFTNDAPVKTILTKAISDALLLEYASSDSYYIDDDKVVDKNYNGADRNINEAEKDKLATIEDTVFKYITDYNNGYKYEFYFSPRNIYVVRDGLTIFIPMSKYSSNIAIYNRFSQNKDIYDGKYDSFDPIGNENYYVFTSAGDVNIVANPHGSEGIINKYSNLYKKSDNVYYGIYADVGYNRTSGQEHIDELSEALKVVKGLIDEDSKKVDQSKAVMRVYNVTMWEDDEFSINFEEYTTDKSNSDKFYKDILNSYQNNRYVFSWNEDYDDGNIFDGIKVKENKDVEYYSNYEYNKSKKTWECKLIRYENGKVEGDQNTQNTVPEEDNTEETETNKGTNVTEEKPEEAETNKGTNTTEEKPEEAETKLPSVESKVIVIDPGHQTKGNSEKEPIGPGASETKAKVTGGATGVSTGKTEYQINLEVALKLKTALENKGYTVIMTRTTNNVNISNSERAKIANNANAAAFIRIHCNSYDDSKVKGTLTMCQTANNPYNGGLASQSYNLSKAVLDSVVSQTGSVNKGVTRTDTMSGINWCTVPTTILEMGFMSNPEEDKLLASDEYQNKIVKGIVAGIEKFLASK